MKSKKNFFRLNMQFFAEGGESGGTESGNSSNAGSMGNNTGGASNGSNGNVGGSQSNQQSGDKSPTLEQLIQSAVDRATNKLGNENKQLKTQIDELMKQKLTDEERIELERKQEKEAFEQEKAQFILEKNKLYAVNSLAKSGISVESDKLESLVSLVLGDDEKAIAENVRSLSDLVKDIVAKKVEETFKTNGRNPAGSGNADKDEKNKKNEVAEQLGKARAEKMKTSNDVLSHYLGGKS